MRESIRTDTFRLMLTTMIFVKDFDRMRRFYEEGFALRVDRSATTEGYVVLTGPDARLALHQIPDAVAARITIDDPPAARSEVAMKPLFSVADLTASKHKLASLGGQIFETAIDDAVDVIDPEGNVLGVSYR